MKLIQEFVRAHPGQSALLVILLLLAGLVDGFGLSAMLPMLNMAFDLVGAGAENPAPPDALTTFVTDAIKALGLPPTLGVLLAIIVVSIALKSLLVFIAEQRMGYLAADVATSLRANLLDAITRASWTFYVDQSVGKLANAMATEAWRASNAYIFGIRLAVVFIETLVYFCVALAVSWQATLGCLLAGFTVWAISHQFVKISKYAGTGQTQSYRALLGLLTDLLQSVKSLKAMGREAAAQTLIARETQVLKQQLRREVLGNAGLDAAQEPMYTLVIVLGIYLALAHFSIELATVTFLTLVLMRLLKRGSKVQKEYQRMITSESAYWALIATVEEAQKHAEQRSGIPAPQFSKHIQLDDVAFSYAAPLQSDAVPKTIVQQVNLRVNFGQLTCLVGESGSGKSTLTDLILGLIQPTSGRILIDGHPMISTDIQGWRQQIGYVPQDNLLLNDSIFKNITLGDEDLTREDAYLALTGAGALTFVNSMPQGLDTEVGERGARLSGGQRQRIMIARALVRQPRLLILDEATSALDSASEAAICDTLAELKGRITILAVTHQPALRKIADHIYSVDAGRVQQTKGTHV